MANKTYSEKLKDPRWQKKGFDLDVIASQIHNSYLRESLE